ncbi:MAG TPA: YrdB family protein [Pseudonocardiaceae bacterium]|jgi:hypothetical protein|nr:YrdB family protein [Pseudonocardiaceae bacterium]
MATTWRVVNLGLAFAVELAALGVLSWWGVRTGAGVPMKILLGLGLPAAAAVLWGLFAAPQATYAVPVLATAVKILVFGAAAPALWQADHRILAVVFPFVVVANLAVIKVGHLQAS